MSDITPQQLAAKIADLDARKKEHEMFRDRFSELASEEDREIIRLEQAIASYSEYGRRQFGDIP
jgi:cytochrome c-type biogenesis protein CcmH/NrfG